MCLDGAVKKESTIRTIKKIFATCLIILLITILISLFGPRFIYHFERGVYYSYDLIFEFKLSKEIIKMKHSNGVRSIALQNFTKKNIKKTCVQWEYATQTYFEERIGERVNIFNESAGFDGNILWLFFSDGSISRVRIPRYLGGGNDKSLTFIEVNNFECTKNTLNISFLIN